MPKPNGEHEYEKLERQMVERLTAERAKSKPPLVRRNLKRDEKIIKMQLRSQFATFVRENPGKKAREEMMANLIAKQVVCGQPPANQRIGIVRLLGEAIYAGINGEIERMHAIGGELNSRFRIGKEQYVRWMHTASEYVEFLKDLMD